MSRANPLPDEDWDAFISEHARRTGWRGSLFTWGTGLLAAGTFFGVLHLAEREVDINSRMAQINAELDAADERLQRAAHALCQAEAGPGAKVLWTSDGDLVCRPAVITAEVTK